MDNPLSRGIAILLTDSPQRAAMMRAALEAAGYRVAAVIASIDNLRNELMRTEPHVTVIDTDAPTPAFLEQLASINHDWPRPMVMFSSDGKAEVIRQVVAAGVSSYIVDGWDASRMPGILDVAIARFEAQQRLLAELALANLKLSERKLVDRAKGILMKSRALSEDEAYHALRKLAMTHNKRIGEAAQMLIDVEGLMS
ncbi:MAG: ANTAR domain-containing response regulator [Burkholderiales bacterium]